MAGKSRWTRLYRRNDPQRLRRNFGMVLQDTWLFGGTVAENIAYGVPGATRAQIEAAAKAACIHSFLSSCRMDMIPHSLTAAPASPRASGSCWPLPAASSPMRTS